MVNIIMYPWKTVGKKGFKKGSSDNIQGKKRWAIVHEKEEKFGQMQPEEEHQAWIDCLYLCLYWPD